MKILTRPAVMVAVDVSTPTQVRVMSDPVSVSTPRGGPTHFALRVEGGADLRSARLRLPTFGPNVTVTVDQLMPVPIGADSALVVRLDGGHPIGAAVPRVLLPLPVRDGVVELSNLHDPSRPAVHIDEKTTDPALLWVTCDAAASASPGLLSSQCVLTVPSVGPTWTTVGVNLTIDSLVLDPTPSLKIAAGLDWDRLSKLYPKYFDVLPPQLFERSSDTAGPGVAVLDQLMTLAHNRRLGVYVPRLQPITKWSSHGPPAIDWSAFDDLAGPWLTGEAFADRVPVGFWPLPMVDTLAEFDPDTQLEYDRLAAAHFGHRGWLGRSPLVVTADDRGVLDRDDGSLLSSITRKLLDTSSDGMVMVPATEDRLPIATPSRPNNLRPSMTDRVITRAPGSVYKSPITDRPPGVSATYRWLAEEPTGGREQDVRSIAWLAFLRDARIVLCQQPLPGLTNESGLPPWFYPGESFGIDHPLATLQLDWLRQAEIDYEYLKKSGREGDREAAVRVSRAVSRPLQLRAGQPHSPLFELLTGAADNHLCQEARKIVGDRLFHMQPAAARGDSSSAIDPVVQSTEQFLDEHHAPTIVVDSVDWTWTATADPLSDFSSEGHWITATVGLSVYNPDGEGPVRNRVSWTSAPDGWRLPTTPQEVPAVPQHQADHVATSARFDINRARRDDGRVTIGYVDGFTNFSTSQTIRLPVAVTEKRAASPVLDADLSDWSDDDAIHLNQPLVPMCSRATVQSPNPGRAATPSSIFSMWNDDALSIAFKVGGVMPGEQDVHRNWVLYEMGRAWMEDSCELLLQPVYADNVTGPTVHAVCKRGNQWVERKLTPDGEWLPFEASGLLYASKVDGKRNWRGELSIPWPALNAPGRNRPGLLRFNFIQHHHSTGQSASWAGPIDESRNDRFSGLLVVHETK